MIVDNLADIRIRMSLVAHGADLLADFFGPIETEPPWTIRGPLLLATRLGYEDIAEFLRDQGR